METLPPLTIDTVLRDVQVDDHRLILWETGRRDSMGKTVLAYRLITPEGDTVFEGADYAVPGIIDDDECLRGLLGFLTLKPGDTDSEYFDKYTPEQMAWVELNAENLSMYGFDESFWEDSENEAPDMPDHPDGFRADSYPPEVTG